MCLSNAFGLDTAAGKISNKGVLFRNQTTLILTAVSAMSRIDCIAAPRLSASHPKPAIGEVSSHVQYKYKVQSTCTPYPSAPTAVYLWYRVRHRVRHGCRFLGSAKLGWQPLPRVDVAVQGRARHQACCPNCLCTRLSNPPRCHPTAHRPSSTQSSCKHSVYLQIVGIP